MNLTLEAVQDLLRRLEDSSPYLRFTRTFECRLQVSDVVPPDQIFVVDVPDLLHDRTNIRTVFMAESTRRQLVALCASQVPALLAAIPSDQEIARMCAYYAYLQDAKRKSAGTDGTLGTVGTR